MFRPLIVTALLSLITPLPPARLAYVQAVTIPLFQCDTAPAYSQLTLCPQVSKEIAATPIPRPFHGSARVLALHLRSESADCARSIRGAAQRFLRTGASIDLPAMDCEEVVARLVTRLYAARS